MKRSLLLILALLMTGCAAYPATMPEHTEDSTKALSYTLPVETEEESETPSFSSSIPLSDIEYRQFVNQEIQKTLSSIITRLTSIQSIKRERMTMEYEKQFVGADIEAIRDIRDSIDTMHPPDRYANDRKQLLKIYDDLLGTMERYETALEKEDVESLTPIANELQNYFNLLTNQYQLDFE